MLTSRNLSLTLLALSFIGFADASFLTIKHYTGGSIPCSLLDGCDTVTRSAYSTIGPVPVALLGALFYLTVFVLTLLYLQQPNQKLIKIIWLLAIFAFLASLGFIYLQAFVINAWCLYCLGSALTSTLILVVASVFVRRA